MVAGPGGVAVAAGGASSAPGGGGFGGGGGSPLLATFGRGAGSGRGRGGGGGGVVAGPGGVGVGAGRSSSGLVERVSAGVGGSPLLATFGNARWSAWVRGVAAGVAVSLPIAGSPLPSVGDA